LCRRANKLDLSVELAKKAGNLMSLQNLQQMQEIIGLFPVEKVNNPLKFELKVSFTLTMSAANWVDNSLPKPERTPPSEIASITIAILN
jgi:hypothetical protein